MPQATSLALQDWNQPQSLHCSKMLAGTWAWTGPKSLAFLFPAPLAPPFLFAAVPSLEAGAEPCMSEVSDPLPWLAHRHSQKREEA